MSPTPNPLEQPPVDAQRIRGADEVAGWRVRQTLEADLDGDRTPERIVLASDVTTNASGAALWEDGHRWAVYVEGGGQRTLLYGAFVPRGHVEAAVTIASSEQRREVLVHERTPEQVRMLVIAYDGPGKARSVSAGHYHVEQWVPDLRR